MSRKLVLHALLPLAMLGALGAVGACFSDITDFCYAGIDCPGGGGAGGAGGAMLTAPAAPLDLSLTLSTTTYGVDVSWQPPPDDEVTGYLVLRHHQSAAVLGPPVNGQRYQLGEQLPGGAEVVFNGSDTATFDSTPPPGVHVHYAVFAVNEDGLFSEPATDSIEVPFPQQNGTIQITDIGNQPVVTITQQPELISMAGTAVYDAGMSALTLSLAITNEAPRILFSPKVVVSSVSAGTVAADGLVVDGRIAAYYGPEGLAVGAEKTRNFVITNFAVNEPVILDVEVLNNPMGIASANYQRGRVNYFDMSGAVDAMGSAFGARIEYELGWKPAEPLDGAVVGGVFGPEGEQLYTGWKSRPIVLQIDMATLQPVVSADLSQAADNYGFTSNVVRSPLNDCLYTLVTSGAHRFNGGPNYQDSSDIDLVQLDRATLQETGRINLVSGAPGQSNGRPVKGNHVALSGNGRVIGAVVEPGQLWVVDVKSFSIIDADRDSDGPQPVNVSGASAAARIAALNQDGSRAFVGYHSNHGAASVDLITEIDLSDFSTTTFSSTSTPGNNAPGWGALVIGPDGLLYIARNWGPMGSVGLSLLDPERGRVSDIAVDVQAMGLLFHPNGQRYYLMQRDRPESEGTILTYNLADHTLIDIDGDSANGQTDLRINNPSTESAYLQQITPF